MLYPKEYGDDPWFPQAKDFKVVDKNGIEGKGIFCYKPFKKGELLAKIHGEVTQEITQHTLQIDETNHLLDLYFVGYLLHSCNPNVIVDMKNRTVRALRQIKANSFLYMDYASTEDVLYKQFHCSCGSANCRGLILGRKEMPLTNETLSSLKKLSGP